MATDMSCGHLCLICGHLCLGHLCEYLDIRQQSLDLIVERRGIIHRFPFPGFSMSERTDLLQGTLDLLILKALVLGPLHGWGISKRLRQMSDDIFEVGQGSLYPALYRLEEKGWISAQWGISEEGRRAKFYTLTAAGKKQFAAERAEWKRFAATVELVLKAT